MDVKYKSEITAAQLLGGDDMPRRCAGKRLDLEISEYALITERSITNEA